MARQHLMANDLTVDLSPRLSDALWVPRRFTEERSNFDAIAPLGARRKGTLSDADTCGEARCSVTVGQLINNRYYLDKLLATSSHSQVFLAQDFVEQRKCIVKRLHLNFCSPKFKQTLKYLFEQEAKILQQLTGKHHQVSQFYNYFKHENSLYLVQEWIPGVTLAQKLRQQHKLSEPETKNILVNLLSVLDYIHHRGIIHRDIKPKNIIIRDRDKLPVLIDFGVAERISDRYSRKVIAGTPGYMSLEQARGQTAYHNDLYSLGLTAICLLTGKSPQNAEFTLSEISVSSDLRDVIERASSIQPERRFASAREMRSALLPSKIVRLPDLNPKKSRCRFGAKSFLLSLQIVIAVASWHYLTAELDNRPPVKFDDLLPETLPIATDADLTSGDRDKEKTNQKTSQKTNNNIFQTVIFTVGTSEAEVLSALGEPVWRKPGFWSNSIAWSYENVVSEGIDLGYMFDTQTNKLRQVEITAPSSTEIGTLRSALTSLLGSSTTVKLERELVAVHQRQKTSYNFATADLQGIIQRNNYDRIYIAVWSVGFH